MNIDIIRSFVRKKLEKDSTGHDYSHILRVENNATELMEDEKFTSEEVNIIIAAILLHDIIDYKVSEDIEKSHTEVINILKKSSATKEEVDEINHIINNMSFSKNLSKKKQLSKLGQIVQDADRLDAIGAIGIARTFYYGGSKGSAFYDNSQPLLESELNESIYKKGSSVINHFYEKLLKIKDLMNTEKGKFEAEKRTKFMEDFLAEFYREIPSIKNSK